MSYKKIKIESNAIATNALKAAKDELLIALTADIPFDATTVINIPIKYADLVLKTSQAHTAESNYSIAVDAEDLKLLALQNYENSFFTIVFLKIKDGFYPESLLTSFGIPLSSRTLPNNDSEVHAEALVTNIVNGNAQIVTLGLPLMVDYTAAQCSVLLGQLVALRNTKNTKLGLKSVADHALKTSFDSCKLFVEDMQNQEDFFFRHLEEGEFRDAERLWGVVFEADKIETMIAVKSKIAITNADANGSVWHIGKALTKRGKPAKEGVTRTAETHGEVVLPTVQDGDLVLTGTLVGHAKIVHPLTVVKGEDQSFTFTFTPLPPEV